MQILSWIVLGLIVGGLAKLIMPGKDPGGCIVTILIGIAGAFLGGYLSTVLGYGHVRGFDWVSLGTAIVGALILLVIYRVLFGKKK